jgi:hypothetical protein
MDTRPLRGISFPGAIPDCTHSGSQRFLPEKPFFPVRDPRLHLLKSARNSPRRIGA